jgi:protein subunit release factor B
MATFSVNPEKAKQLAQRMVALGVRETHIEETFVRSGGHGGQNVNKSATCVMLLHRPTGFQVKCQTTRQQGLNRFIAWRLLLDKIENAQTEKAADERSRIEKARRQKRKKSHGAKVRMLADKSRRADKKASRRRIGDFDS